LRAIPFTLGSFLCQNGCGKRIKQIDKIEKPIIRLKRLGRRKMALLGVVFVVDLLPLTSIDVPTKCATSLWKS